MLLVIQYLLRLEHIPVKEFLQLDQGRGFMTADIAKVIRTAATDGQRLRVLELLHIYLIIGRITVILYAKGHRLEELVILHQLDIPNCMDLFSPANYFIGTISIYILNKVR